MTLPMASCDFQFLRPVKKRVRPRTSMREHSNKECCGFNSLICAHPMHSNRWRKLQHMPTRTFQR